MSQLFSGKDTHPQSAIKFRTTKMCRAIQNEILHFVIEYGIFLSNFATHSGRNLLCKDILVKTKRYARLVNGNVGNFQWTARTVYRFSRIAWAGYSFSVQGNSYGLH